MSKSDDKAIEKVHVMDNILAKQGVPAVKEMNKSNAEAFVKRWPSRFSIVELEKVKEKPKTTRRTTKKQSNETPKEAPKETPTETDSKPKPNERIRKT